MNPIRALFKKRPKDFSRKVEVFYNETLSFQTESAKHEKITFSGGQF